jgi:SAM-dependent methyltransferase
MKKLGNYLSKGNRKRLANKIKIARKMDTGKSIKGKIWRKNRSLKCYSVAMRVNLKTKIQEIISKKGTCKLLDIGCGDCHALAEAKHTFGNNITTHGLRLYGKRDHQNFADFLIQRMVNKIKVGSIENYIFKEKYDLIVSFAGIHYTTNTAVAIEKVANALTINGEAYFQMKKDRIPTDLIRQINTQGFEMNLLTKPGYATIIHLKRTTRQKTELTRFIIKEAKKKINPKINIQEKLTE